jgi:hypothetical protein
MKLEEAKDQVAKKHNYINWHHFVTDRLAYKDFVEVLMIEAAELYAQSKQADFFNSIEDLRPYLLCHPDQQMIRTSCLHFLGDKYQDFENTIKAKQADAWEEGYNDGISDGQSYCAGYPQKAVNPYKITSPQLKQPNPS